MLAIDIEPPRAASSVLTIRKKLFLLVCTLILFWLVFFNKANIMRSYSDASRLLKVFGNEPEGCDTHVVCAWVGTVGSKEDREELRLSLNWIWRLKLHICFVAVQYIFAGLEHLLLRPYLRGFLWVSRRTSRVHFPLFLSIILVIFIETHLTVKFRWLANHIYPVYPFIAIKSIFSSCMILLMSVGIKWAMV